jgi:mannose-6-phosphate isomerase
VHTLGPGSIIVETQQQSDTTFRLYDYGRPRELHLNDGLRVIKEQVSSGRVRPRVFSNLDGNGNRTRPLVSSQYFVVEQFELSSEQPFPELGGKSSAQILVATDGDGTLVAEGFDPVAFAKGDAVVVPATIRRFRIRPRTRVQFLKSYVPGVAVAEPETAAI